MEIVVNAHGRGFGLRCGLLATREQSQHCGGNERDYDAGFHLVLPGTQGACRTRHHEKLLDPRIQLGFYGSQHVFAENVGEL